MPLLFHGGAFLLGCILDMIIGDPQGLWHPIIAIGKLISFWEKRLYQKDGAIARETGTVDLSTKEPSGNEKNARPLFLRGIFLEILVLLTVGLTVALIMFICLCISPWLYFFVEAIMTGQILAGKSLRTESMKVYHKLKEGDLDGARHAVSMIVSRDTDKLNESAVARAAVETVAENTSDGVTAPLIMLALGGPLLGFLYKGASTMDSMLGYKNERYLYFGRAAARMDDFLNFLPSRITALFMIQAAYLTMGAGAGKRAFAIWQRDRRKHDSPNAGQTEAVMAGALGIRIGGTSIYFGKEKTKPYIGDALKEVDAEDIKRANDLAFWTSVLLGTVLFLGIMAGAFVYLGLLFRMEGGVR